MLDRVNVSEYIESGILEAYVLGSLTAEQAAEVEHNISSYPELATEVAKIEASFEQVAHENAEAPPAFLKGNIMDQLDFAAEEEEEAPQANTTKSIPLNSQEEKKPSWARAAVWAAVLVSVLSNFMLLSQRNESRELQDKLASALDSMEIEQNRLVAVVDEFIHERDMVLDPDMETVIMHGSKKMASTICWSKEKGDAYLSLHNMPMPPEGMHYKFWVAENGKPKDMGVVPVELVGNNGMMKKIPAVVGNGHQGFAISLEDAKSDSQPTDIYVCCDSWARAMASVEQPSETILDSYAMMKDDDCKTEQTLAVNTIR